MKPFGRAALVVLAFAVVTIALTWIWGEWGRVAYGNFLKQVAPPIYDLIGFGDARVGAYRQRYINFVPFVGLILVTPGLGWRRRALGLACGLFALFVGHLALNLTEAWSPKRHLPFVPSLVSDALPFVLWVVAAWPAVAGWLPGGASGETTSPADRES